jgi:hypothetical protein
MGIFNMLSTVIPIPEILPENKENIYNAKYISG